MLLYVSSTLLAGNVCRPFYYHNNMALNRKLAPYHQKLINGDYDTILHTLPVFTTFPALVLVTVDLHNYAHRTSYLILDAVVLSFLSLNILWVLVWNRVPRHRHGPLPFWVVCIDLLLLIAMMSLGDTTLSMRSSPHDCSKSLGECSGTAKSIMIAAGVLMIITS